MPFTLSKQFRFEAAHSLPNVGPAHPCRNLHGHSYRLWVSVRGDVDPETGWVLDYGELSKIVRPVLSLLDHGHLNEVAGLENPTSEMLAVWMWERLAPSLPHLFRIEILETCQTRCEYDGPEA